MDTGPNDVFAPVRNLQGKHVKIIAKDHPWYDYTGRITGFEFFGDKPGCVIKLDEVPDHKCTVFSGHDLKLI